MKRSILVLLSLFFAISFFATEGALSGLFIVNEAGKIVRFSKGNLQYKASSKTWRFAEEQYDCIGSGNNNRSSTYSGWIDLFSWGTSGWNSGAVIYQPWEDSHDDNNHLIGGDKNNNLTGIYANADWGVYNAISNGGNEKGLWRTPHYLEWRYIIYDRKDASNLRGQATVNNIHGYVLLPDNWVLPQGLNFSPMPNNWTTNVYTSSQWNKMESNGAVFFPAAGLENPVQDLGIRGLYTSSANCCSYTTTASGVPSLCFEENRANVSTSVVYQRCGEASVRLIQDALVLNCNEKEGDIVVNQTDNINVLVVSVVPKEGYEFVEWSDGNTDNPRIINLSNGESIDITALFRKIPLPEKFTITVASLNPEMGTTTGSGKYEKDSIATIAAIPKEGYKFKQWLDGNTENPRNILVTADATFVAMFEESILSDLNNVNCKFNINDIINDPEVRIYNLNGVEITNYKTNLLDGIFIFRLRDEVWKSHLK